MVPCLFLALTLLLAVVAAAPAAEPAKLRRVPRIYNALITTDEELLPSQAYPAVAPVIRPYSPYSPYSPYPPYGLPPNLQGGSYGLYAPDPYSLQSYSRIPGFNDTLQDPEASLQRQPPQAPLYSLQPRQTIPQISNQIKNNRPPNRDIPDVPPPPLPLSPPRGRDDKTPERKPENYPPAPPQGLPFL